MKYDEQELMALIGAEFGNVAEPSTISVSTFDDDGTETFFANKKPDTISTAETLSHASALWFLTPDAFVYFVAPYLRSLVVVGEETSVIFGHFVAQFGSSSSSDRVSRARDIISILSSEQRQVICRILDRWSRMFASDHDLTTALKRLRGEK